MTTFFSADEIFLLGSELERNGEDFYRAAADCCRAERARKVFEDLCGEERKHAKTFRSIADRLSRDMARPMIRDSFSESDLFLTALAETQPLGEDPDEIETLARECEDDLALLDLGIDYEKNLLVYYHWVHTHTRPEWGQEKLEQIVRQEREHIIRLNHLRRELHR